jgi:hypothetical protein
MKKKIKRYAEGKAVTTRSDDEIEFSSKNPYKQYPGEGWKEREKEQGEKNLESLKSFGRKLFGGGNDESKFSDLESVKKTKTLEEQIGRKAEPKAEPKEEPRRKISDYSTNKGITTVSEEDAPYKVEKTAPPKTSGGGSRLPRNKNAPGYQMDDDTPANIGNQNTFNLDKAFKGKSAEEIKQAKAKEENSTVSGPGGARAVDKTARSFKGTTRPENATMGGRYNKTGIPATDAEGFKALKEENKAKLRAEETEKQRTFKERAEAAKAEADKAEKKAAKAAKKEGAKEAPKKESKSFSENKAKSSSTAGKMPGPKMDPYSMTLGSDLDPKRMMSSRRTSRDNEMKKGGQVKKYAKGGSVSSASSRGDGIAMRGKTRGKIY